MYQDSYLLGDLVEKCGAFSRDTQVQVTRYRSQYSAGIPLVSFIVPVYNQAELIAINLESMRKHAQSDHEFIVIVDGCTDTTEQAVRSWAEKAVNNHSTLGVTVAVIADGVFETMSDTVGVRLACGEYLLEVQADMNIHERGFDEVMINALREFPEIVAISGRGAHSFRLLVPDARCSFGDMIARASRQAVGVVANTRRRYRPTRVELHMSDSIGRIGDLIECAVKDSDRDRWLFVHETVMRGPIAIRRTDFLDLDGFDTENFFLGNDDHDFAIRALTEAGRRMAYLPIGFESPIMQGSTRAHRTPEAQARFNELRSYYASRFGLSALAREAPKIVPPKRFAMRVSLES